MKAEVSIEQAIRHQKKYKHIQKARNIINKFFLIPVYSRTFGVNTAWKLFLARKKRDEWLEAFYDAVVGDCGDLIQEYALKYKEYLNVRDKKQKETSRRIFVCWLQGEDQAPKIVKECIQSIRKNAPADSEVIVIDKDNLFEYVDVDQFFVDYVNRGKITLTFFSDIIRFSLLKKYGGLWIDATVFVTDRIPDYCFEKIYSIQYTNGENTNRVNDFYGRLTSFLIGGDVGYPLFAFCLDIFKLYLVKHKQILEGHLINIVYAIFYREISFAKNDIDAIGVNNTNVERLSHVANWQFDEKMVSEITKDQIFHKLNWRNLYVEEGTVYSYLKNEE